MYHIQPLTQETPPARELIARLEKKRPASVPDWVWKDLFIIALERLVARKQETVAKLSASEALLMIDSVHFEQDEDGGYHEADTEFWHDALEAARRRDLGRGHLNKLTRGMDHDILLQLYTLLRDALSTTKTREEITDAIRRPWKLMRGSDVVPEMLIGIAETNTAKQAALEIVAKAYGMKSESLVVIFRRNGWTLDQPSGDLSPWPQDKAAKPRPSIPPATEQLPVTIDVPSVAEMGQPEVPGTEATDPERGE